MTATELDAIARVVERLGLPLALVVVMGAGLVALCRYIVKLMATHKSEREQDRAAHLTALGQLSAAVNGVTVEVTRNQTETVRALDRIEQGVHALARGCATLATLAVVALLAFLAFACSSRRVVKAEERAELHETTAASSAVQEQRTEQQAETVTVARREGPRAENARTLDFAPPAFPGQPLRDRLRRAAVRRAHSAGARLDQRKEASTSVTAGRSEQSAQTGQVAAASSGKLMVEREAKLLSGGWLLGLALAGLAIAGALQLVAHFGGPLAIFKLATAAVRRISGGNKP